MKENKRIIIAAVAICQSISLIFLIFIINKAQKSYLNEGVTYYIVQNKDLDSLLESGDYSVFNGNLLCYDTLVFERDAASIDTIKTSDSFKKMLKIGIKTDGSDADVFLDALQNFQLYYEGEIYSPYYLLINNFQAVILFDADEIDKNNFVFSSREDSEWLMCSEDDDEEVAAVSDLSSIVHENFYSEGCVFQDDEIKDADSAFEKGNTEYLNCNFELAESYYLLSLNNRQSFYHYSEFDAMNNLVLARLQQEKNEDAYTMASYLVSNNPLKDASSTEEYKNSFGYIINFLVAIQANKKDKAEAVSKTANSTISDINKELNNLAEENPGEYVRFLTALVYNDAYIEMENTANRDELKKITSTLDKINENEKKTFDEYDSDIHELQEYLSAKIDTLAS